MDRYYRYSKFLKDKYGQKVYKLPVNLPVTCPNRDGFLNRQGCSFCGEEGAGFENLSAALSVKDQLLKNRDYIGERYGAERFIAYYQNFTNTYLPLEKLLEYIAPALEVEDIVEISLSTRPDCINSKYLSEIQHLINSKGRKVELSLEMGLQTVNYHTLIECNRGHTLAEFIDAIRAAEKYGVEVGVHLILNLPGDTSVDVIENAKILSALRVANVKLHALYIREGTEFGDRYQDDELEIISLEEYIDRVITFLEYLDPKIAVQRLLGRAPEEEETLFVNWDHSWWKIQQLILEEMEKRGSYQGRRYNYLEGKALKRFK